MSNQEWEAHGEQWAQWARAHEHDAYWFYRDAFFDGFLPAPRRRTMEIGCGEGRVIHDLQAHGHTVVAVDVSFSLLRYAAAEAPGRVARADASALPFRDGSVDLVVAYNSLQVVHDMPGTLREAGRVLHPGGVLAVCVSHPVTDLGEFLDDSDDAPLVMRRNYFTNEWVDDTVERDGLTMRFTGWTYSLEDYSRAIEAAGFHITALREPRPRHKEMRFARRQRVPMFLLLRAERTTERTGNPPLGTGG